MSWIRIFLVFLEGFLAFISPCILPLLPVYVLYLSGEVADKPLSGTKTEPSSNSDRKAKRNHLIVHTLFFILCFTIVFLLLGATSTAIGQLLAVHRQLLERISGAVIIVLGIHMTGWIHIPFLDSEHRLDFAKKSGGVFSALLMGVAFSLGWTPCLWPFLGSALALSSQSKTLLQGMALLFVFSMGLAIPFLLTSLLFQQLASVFTWFRKHGSIIRVISGLILVALGLLLLFGLFGYYARIYSFQ